MRELTPADMEGGYNFIDEYVDLREKFIDLKTETYNKILHFEGKYSPMKLVDLLGFYFNSVFMDFSLEVDYESDKFIVTRSIQDYVDTNNNIVAYLQVLDVDNPFESFIPSRIFKNKTLNEIKEQLYDMHSIANNFYSDAVVSKNTFIEKVYAKEDFLMSVFSVTNNLEKLNEPYSVMKFFTK